MNVLVIAPHADDEVLGCGGSIVKHVGNGDKAYLCIVTMAYTPEWTREQIDWRYEDICRVANLLGIHHVFYLNYPTVKLDTVPQKEINDRLSEAIDTVKPEVVYIPHPGDVNRDHQIVFQSSMVALRPTLTNPPSTVLAYETLSETGWLSPYQEHNFIPNVFVGLSEHEVDMKIEAMKLYRHGIKDAPHPRSVVGITNLAQHRGMSIGIDYAEAFSLIRQIKRS